MAREAPMLDHKTLALKVLVQILITTLSIVTLSP